MVGKNTGKYVRSAPKIKHVFRIQGQERIDVNFMKLIQENKFTEQDKYYGKLTWAAWKN